MDYNCLNRYKALQENLPLWKKEMYAAYCNVEKSTSTDVLGLYIKLEKIFQKHFSAGNVEEGQDFLIEMGGLSPYKLRFYEKATEIYNFDEKDNSEHLLLSLEDSYRKEYGKLLAQEQLLKVNRFAIGRRYPDSLKEYLTTIKPGQVIAFEEGKSYVCRRNTTNTVYLQEVFSGNIKNLTLDNFRKNLKNQVVVDLSDKNSIQAFYRENKKHLTHSIEGKFLDIHKAQSTMNEIYGSLPIFKTKKVTFGPIELRVRRSVTKKNTALWYDEKGKPLSEDTVRYLIGFLNSTPSQTTYNRKNPTALKSIEDEAFAQDIEVIMQSHDFDKATNLMMKYVVDNKNDLTINTIAYECDNNNQISAVSYTFKEVAGQCKIFKAVYTDADFQSDIKEIKEVSAEEFYNFCKKKYTDEHNILVSQALSEIDEKYGKAKNNQTIDNRKKVAEKIALEEENTAHISIINKEDISFGENEYNDIIYSFLEDSCKENNISVEDLLSEISNEELDTEDIDYDSH